MNIILTGATGFIGSHLLPELVKKNNLLVIVRSINTVKKLNSFNKYKNIQFLIFHKKSSINSLAKLFTKFQPHLIIHLATFYINSHRYNDIDHLINSNIRFGTKIIEAGFAAGCKKVINTSTIWEYYQNKKIPVNLYAASKSAFDQILNFYYSAYNMTVINLYLSDTYGDTDHRKKLIPLLLKNIKSSKKISITSGLQKLQLFHIDDIIELYLEAIKEIKRTNKPFKFEYFPKGEILTINELIRIYKKVTKSSCTINIGKSPNRPRSVFKISKGKSNLKLQWKAKKKISLFFKNKI